eukprot:3246122-Amphidinium_carterae.1
MSSSVSLGEACMEKTRTARRELKVTHLVCTLKSGPGGASSMLRECYCSNLEEHGRFCPSCSPHAAGAKALWGK